MNLNYNNNIVLHVGFSKTGTTTLQRHLFKNHSQIRYLGKPYPDETLQALVHRLIMQESLVYRASAVKEYMENTLFDKPGDPGKTVVLSDEMLVSYSKARDKGLVARRLKEVFPAAKILFTIRNQFDILTAAYLSRGRLLTYVPKKYSGLHVSFDDWLELSLENIERSYLGHIDYIKTVDYYADLFGKENVSVLLLEEFVNHRKTYMEKLAAVLNIDIEECLKLTEDKHEHKEISQSQLNFERFRTRLYPLSRVPLVFGIVKPFFSLRGLFRKEKTAMAIVSEKWRQRLGPMYREGNRKLVDFYGLPLGKFGYPL